jgi:hypothetical protein
MKITALVIGLLLTASYTATRASIDREQQSADGHLSGLTARITMRDGAIRTVRLEGVGCPINICSRTAIKAKAGADREVYTWLDSLVAIRDTTDRDALFVSKDGTSKRMSLITDFRVLYLAKRLGGAEKLDLARIRSLELVPAAR